jgi:hypothetical protein
MHVGYFNLCRSWTRMQESRAEVGHLDSLQLCLCYKFEHHGNLTSWRDGGRAQQRAASDTYRLQRRFKLQDA